MAFSADDQRHRSPPAKKAAALGSLSCRAAHALELLSSSAPEVSLVASASVLRMPAGRSGSTLSGGSMTPKHRTDDARVGDWVECRGIHGEPPRRGRDRLEILGRPGHAHFRVRWDEQHGSIVLPADAVSVVRHARGATPRRRG